MSSIRERVAALDGAQRAELARRLGIESNPRDGRLMAYVVPRAAPPDGAALRAFLRQRLPDHMVPSAFVPLADLPHTPNGKLDVHALPWPEAGDARDDDTFVAPASAAEATLAAIWSELLGGVRVGVHDNFFEIGGDSILSIQVVARAARAGLAIAPDQIFRHPTIAELARAAAAAPRSRVEQDVVSGPVPLTPIQSWFLEQPLVRPGHWHHVLWLAAPADFDAARFETALRRLVHHHDALRLRIERSASGWRQWHDAPDAPLRIEHVEQVDAAALRAATDAIAARADPFERLGVSALIARRAGAPPRIALVIHHLLVDPISWGVLLEDLEAAYADPDAVLPPKTTSFRTWAEALAAYAESPRLGRERAWWDALPAAPDVPREVAGELTEASVQTVQVSLDRDSTRALLDGVPAAYGTRTDEVLLAALTRALSGWTGRTSQCIGVERHGREAIAPGIDLSRTIGWFTTFFPLVLSLEGAADPGAALRAVKEGMRAVPGNGIGYGVLRYLARPVGERRVPFVDPLIIFNFAGRTGLEPGRLFRPVGVPAASRAPENRRTHLFEINAHVADGRLEVLWGFSDQAHQRHTVENLAARLLEELRVFIDHCTTPETGSFTPSDFPEAELSQEELDRFLGGLSP